MNCRQGDMAWVMRGMHVISPHAGKIVMVIRSMPSHPLYGAMWEVEFSHPVSTVYINDISQSSGSVTCCSSADAWLRPIRDIGPDEVDEVIQRLGTPHGVTA